MSILEKNIKFFKENNENLYKIIMEEKSRYDIKVDYLENHDNFLVENNKAKCYLNSNYNLENEMDMIFRNVSEDSEVIILFGLGIGYAIEYVEKNFKRLKRLIIVEPTNQICREFIKRKNAEEYFGKSNNITLIINQSEKHTSELIAGYLNQNINIGFAFHLNYRSLFEEYYENFQRELLIRIRSMRSLITTISGFANLWLLNAIMNVQSESVSIDKLKNIFYKKPAIIVSAGPSLNKNIHLLNQAKQNAIILAVGSAIEILENNNITPHFRVAIDPNPVNKNLNKSFGTNSNLLFSNKLYYEVVKDYPWNKVNIVLCADVVGKYVYNKAGIEYSEVATGTSVANAATNLLCELGCSHIIFLGQDMCFYRDNLYAEGIDKQLGMDYWGEHNKLEMKDINGETVYTIFQYLNIKLEYEKTIPKYKEIKFINASEGGLGIENAENKKLKDVLSSDIANFSMMTVEELNEYIKNLQMEEKNKFKIEKALESIVDQSKEIEKIAIKYSSMFKEINKKLDRNLNISRISRDIIYFENILEEELKKFDFYDEVILNALSKTIQANILKNQYNGNDKKQKLNSKLKIIIGKIADISSYCEMATSIIKESKTILEKE